MPFGMNRWWRATNEKASTTLDCRRDPRGCASSQREQPMSHTMNRFLVTVVLVAACALGAYISRHSIAQAFATRAYERSEGVARERRLNQLSFAAFERAELGMSYPDVVELVRVGGTEV